MIAGNGAPGAREHGPLAVGSEASSEPPSVDAASPVRLGEPSGVPGIAEVGSGSPLAPAGGGARRTATACENQQRGGKNRDRLKDVGLRLRKLYPMGDPNIVAQKVTPERIEAMVDEVTKGFRGDVGVVPRQFLRRLVNFFDAIAENPDAPLPPIIADPSPVELRAAEGKKPIEYEPEPDDDKGYSVASVVEF